MTDFKTQYPKTHKLFSDYLQSEIIKSGAAPEMVAAFPIDRMIAMAVENRAAYDMLDAAGYVVSVWEDGGNINNQSGWGWQYRIRRVGQGDVGGPGAGSRKETENLAFKFAFELIEKS